MSTLSEIELEVLKLPEEQRISLISSVLNKSETSNASEMKSLWDDEICRRIELLDSGRTERIPSSKVFQELDERMA